MLKSEAEVRPAMPDPALTAIAVLAVATSLSAGGCGGDTKHDSAGTAGGDPTGQGGTGGGVGDESGGAGGTTASRGGSGGPGASSGGSNSSGGTTSSSGGLGGSAGDGHPAGGAGAAGGGSIDVYACEQNADCDVRSASCCGGADPIAVNGAFLDEWMYQNCWPPPGCPPPPPPALGPQAAAICEAGRCTAIDLRQDPMTACSSPDDCVMRKLDCCNCGDASTTTIAIALSQELAYVHLACDPGTECDSCVHIFDPGYKTDCLEGNCVLLWDP
jgi:hypothetical protein